MIQVEIDSTAAVKSLQRVRLVLGSEAALACVKAGARVLLNEVVPNAPYLTGTYRRSIRIEDVSETEVVVGSDVPYARRLEFGFVGVDKRGRHYHQAPQPHWRPAMAYKRAAIVGEMADAAWDLIQKELK